MTLLQLKMFLSDNLRRTQTDQDPHIVPTRTGFKQVKEVREINDVGEAILALNNLSDIWRFLHPQDPSMQAIFLVALEHFVAGNLDSCGVGPINNFFKVATLENAHSASNEASKLSVKLLITNTFLRASL